MNADTRKEGGTATLIQHQKADRTKPSTVEGEANTMNNRFLNAVAAIAFVVALLYGLIGHVESRGIGAIANALQSIDTRP